MIRKFYCLLFIIGLFSLTNAAAQIACVPKVLDTSSAVSDTGFAWMITKNFGTPADNSNVNQSILELFEDGVPLGPSHSFHYTIRETGLGRYSHKSEIDGTGEALRFSASNNSDPRSNGKVYTYCPGDPVSDTQAPTIPGCIAVTATVISSSQIDLSWPAATDNVSVTGYKVFRNGTQIADINALTLADTGLLPETSYSYTVKAHDGSGNDSGSTQTVTATTLADTPPPPPPETDCTHTPINVANAISDGGFAWMITKNFGTPPDNSNVTQSTLRLFEDNIELFPAHSFHYDIRTTGLGAFSHKSDNLDGTGEKLRFSASNNTDPRTNGKSYSYCTTPAAPEQAPPVSVIPGAAFPGAQGGGAGADGGNGGVVIEVTNTNDSGTGSLRACIQTSGPRTCVFRTGGTISLASTLSVNNPYITVAGQTAPGGGIQIRCTSINGTCVSINAHNVVWQYTRVRHGYKSGALDSGSNIMAFGHDIVIDHNSTYWNLDEGIGSWGWSGSSDPRNITISSNIIAEGLQGHSTGTITGGANANGQINIDMIGNLYMNNSHRNPLLKNKSSRVVNNTFYNNLFHAGQYMGGISVDNIGNQYIKGPLMNLYTRTTWDWHPIQIVPSPGVDSPNTGSNQSIPSIYVSGNTSWYQPNENGSQWLHTVQVPGENGTEINSGPASFTYQRISPMANPAFPITAIPASQLDTAVIPTVGASRKLDCAGNWVMNRDSTDTRLMNQYTNKTGISSIPVTENSSGIGGYPTLSAGTPCLDSDHDGMPDEYEVLKGFNPTNAADRNTVASNGYTNLANFLAGPL